MGEMGERAKTIKIIFFNNVQGKGKGENIKGKGKGKGKNNNDSS